MFNAFRSKSLLRPGNLDPMLSSSDSRSKDETGGLIERVEEDPSKVNFHFLKTSTEI